MSALFIRALPESERCPFAYYNNVLTSINYSVLFYLAFGYQTICEGNINFKAVVNLRISHVLEEADFVRVRMPTIKPVRV